MPTFTVTVGGTLGAAGGIATDAPVAEQLAAPVTETAWDEITHGKSEVSAS